MGTESEVVRAGAILEAEIADEAGHVVEVTIARPGTSQNGYIYSEDVLRAATPLWNGAPAFLDHPTALDLTRAGGRSLRDLVGVYEGARFESGRGIRARLRLHASDHGAFDTVREAVSASAAGRASAPVGISADWRLLKSPASPVGGRPRWLVHSITAVNSGDLVVRPSAGGSFDRILEAETPEQSGDGGGLVPEAAVATPEQGSSGSGESSSATPGSTVVQPSGLTDEFRTLVAASVAEAVTPLRQQLAAAQLEARLAGSGLPAAAVSSLRAQLSARVYESGEIDQAIASMRSLLGDVFGQGAIRGVGSALDPGVRQGISPLDRIQASFDRLFGLEVAPELATAPRLTGIREAYVLLTGDKFFSGRYVPEEAAVREANEVTNSVLANVVLNSMTKRIVRDYQAQPKWWEPIVVKVPVMDMKQQHRLHLNDFAALSSVSENGPYTNLAWGDSRENYTPTKFGNLVVVTLETFLNDDVHAMTRIPTKVAHAAGVTVNEQVANLFTQSSGTGPLMADSNRVFDAANHQSNTSTSTAYDLSSSALQNAMTVMEKFTNSASKRIGVRGRYLMIPPDLRWTAAVITQSQYAAGSANNDINPLSGAIVPIVVPQFTTAYQWYLLADPAQIESIEIGFLNGREEPELLVQDNPTAGAVFTNDAISYKVRHIYGLGWLDFRGAFAALPGS